MRNSNQTNNIIMIFNLKKLFLLTIIMCFVMEVYMAAINPIPTHQKMRMCSRALSDTVALVCKGRYNTWNDTSEPHTDERNGIADICCKIGCTLSELNKYCL